MVPDQAETNPDKDESVPEKIVMSLLDSSRDSSSSSDEVFHSDSHPDTEKEKKGSSSLDDDVGWVEQEDDHCPGRAHR